MSTHLVIDHNKFDELLVHLLNGEVWDLICEHKLPPLGGEPNDFKSLLGFWSSS